MSIQKYAKILFVYFAFLYLYRINSHTLLIDTFNAPIKNADTNYTYWLAHLIQFPKLIISNYWLCLIIDAGILFSTIACVFLNKKRWVFAIILIILFLIQRITIESFSCSHTKSISCLFAAIFPFCFKKERDTQFMIEFGRYFLIYIMVISAYHKFTHGAIGNPENFTNILINQHVDLATLYPEHISYKIAVYLIKHPLCANMAFYTLFIVQISFIFGIFSKRFDRILLILLISFAVLTYFMMRIYNFDITVLGLTLLYFSTNQNKTT